MNQYQKALLDILQKENEQARKNDDLYFLGDTAKLFSTFVEQIRGPQAKRIIDEYKTGVIRMSYAAETSLPFENCPVVPPKSYLPYLLWYIYGIAKGPGGLRWADIITALSELFQPPSAGTFYKVSQSPQTNALARIMKESLQFDIFGNANAVVRIGGSNYRYMLPAGYKWDPERGVRLLDYLLYQYQLKKQAYMEFPMMEYAEIRREDMTTKSKRDFFLRNLKDDLAALGAWGYYEENGPDKAIIGGGTNMVVNGVVKWSFNPQILPKIKRLSPMDYSQETFEATGTAFWVSRAIDMNWRMNEGKKRASKMSVAALLAATDLKSIEDCRAQRMSEKRVRARVFAPLFDALDSLQRITYDTYTEAGKRVDDPIRDMSLPELLSAYILIDYSEYEKHPDRVANREKHKAAENAANGKKRSKKDPDIKRLEKKMADMEKQIADLSEGDGLPLPEA